VTAVCGDFYIGGRQFDSLQDLIGYYTHKSDLLKHERLITPVAPPEPVDTLHMCNWEQFYETAITVRYLTFV
jgi:hypothetical protein